MNGEAADITATRLPVTFYLPEPDIDRLRLADPDRDWRLFTSGERVWILQTYLRLARAGLPVELSAALPDDGVLVMSAQRRHEVERDVLRRRRLLVVATVQDLSPPAFADVRLVQDPRQAGPIHTFEVTHWPQPGLLPRDPARGARIERVEFKGSTENLHPSFRSRKWVEGLASLGISWHEDALPSSDAARDPSLLRWNDYREVDLALAVRPPGVVARKAKPASKLIAAWLAACPALLGPEPAFRALRRSLLDYVEVRSAAEALREVAALKDDPTRYLKMIENGRVRGAEYSVERVTRQWADILFTRLPALQRDPRFERWRRRTWLLRRVHDLLRR